MILTKDEAISLILNYSENNKVSSTTKLNKLLARLNLFLIPTEFEFVLNKYGSYCQELKLLTENENFAVGEYKINETPHKSYQAKPKGLQLAKEVEGKLIQIMDSPELSELKKEIGHLSTLGAKEISDNEHKKLFVDTTEKFKLVQRVNSTFIDMMDLYEGINKIEESSLANIKLKALIEYCYFLAKYFKEKRFSNIAEDYDYNAYMFDYYLLFALENNIIPFLKLKEKNEKTLSRYYNYIVDSIKDKHPFSLDNPELKELIA